MKNTKPFLLAANWKMNKSLDETKKFFSELSYSLKEKVKSEIVVSVPFTHLHLAVQSSCDGCIKVGAQNCHWAESGAFTGEVSAKTLQEMGVLYTIVGHSERRSYFGETDDTVNKRLRFAIASGLKVILCVGENLDERENNITFERLSIQTKLALKNVTKEEIKNVVIAYEPVWAIGTGKTASASQANSSCEHIRAVINELYGEEVAESTDVLYGGSLNSENAFEILSQKDINGGLIGGASLKAEEFLKIVKVAESI